MRPAFGPAAFHPICFPSIQGSLTMKRIHITRLATVAGVTSAIAVAAIAFAGDKVAPAAAAVPAKTRTVKFVSATPEMMARFNTQTTQSNDGMRAYVDAETKGLRAATQAELNENAAASARVAAPASAKRSAAAVAAPSARKLANGASRLKLDESSLSYAVATLGPDGKLKTACIEDQPNQEAALRTAVAQKGADSHEK
jgi:hypothetical protein